MAGYVHNYSRPAFAGNVRASFGSRPGYQRVHSDPDDSPIPLKHLQSPIPARGAPLGYYNERHLQSREWDPFIAPAGNHEEQSPPLPSGWSMPGGVEGEEGLPPKPFWQRAPQGTPTLSSWERFKSQEWSALFLLIMVCFMITFSCGLLLFGAWAGSQASSEDSTLVTADGITLIVFAAAFPNLISAALNEVLVEKCWRRIQYFSLMRDDRDMHSWTDTIAAEHLQASNFGWLDFLKRILHCSRRDWRMLLTWIVLRFGTALALASPQLSVTWQLTDQYYNQEPTYVAEKRIWWLLVPPLCYVAVIVLTFALWRRFPNQMMSTKCNDMALWEAYGDFRREVKGGSIASINDVAKYYKEGRPDPGLKPKRHQPGLQLWSKFKGASFGLVASFMPLILAWAWTYTHQGNRDELWRNDKVRFLFRFAFLVQNIMYVITLDFVIWNVSIEGLCRSRSSSSSPHPRSVSHLEALGKSAGLVLLLQLFRRRRPLRATLLLWLFYIQACAMRTWTTLYFVAFTMLRYDTDDDQKDIYDPNFWVGYSFISLALIILPIFVWLCVPFQAPMCSQDGWRWSIISDPRFLSTSSDNDVGDYGIATDRTGRKAKMGRNLLSFADAGPVDLF